MPDEIVQHILSQMQNARDIASCSCVSKQWVDSVSYIPFLYFPRNAFELVPPSRADATMTRMVSSAIRLEELVVYCPFLASSLASWLSLRSRTLRVLELRMDSASEDKPDSSLVDCVGLAKGLEELKLWGLTMTKSPDWGVFVRLRNLEIDRATVTGDALKAALGACPNLTDLRMISCSGAESVVVEMERLQNCSLDFHVTGYCSLSICCPMLRVLQVQGFDTIRVSGNHHLACLSIQKNSGN